MNCIADDAKKGDDDEDDEDVDDKKDDDDDKKEVNVPFLFILSLCTTWGQIFVTANPSFYLLNIRNFRITTNYNPPAANFAISVLGFFEFLALAKEPPFTDFVFCFISNFAMKPLLKQPYYAFYEFFRNS